MNKYNISAINQSIITSNANSISASDYWKNTTVTSASGFDRQYAIQGQMLTVTRTFSDMEWSQKMYTPDSVKVMLMEQLVKELFTSKHIEFTKIQESASFEHKFYARVFVVPDTQVRIIRENKVATSLNW